MNYLKRVGKGLSIQEDPAEYLTAGNNHPDDFSPITDN